VFQNRTRLLQSHPRKPLDEILQLSTVLQILEERAHRHPCAAEHPDAANTLRVALYCRTPGPIDHTVRIARKPFLRNAGQFPNPPSRSPEEYVAQPRTNPPSQTPEEYVAQPPANPPSQSPEEYVAQPRTNPPSQHQRSTWRSRVRIPPSTEPGPLRLATPSTGTDHDSHRPPPSRAVTPAAASPTHNATSPPARRQGMTANAAPVPRHRSPTPHHQPRSPSPLGERGWGEGESARETNDPDGINQRHDATVLR